MKHDVIFSVVIPAYNAESFIEDCVASVCEQKFDRNRYEVIVVDDGSSDGTTQKVRILQQRYGNLKLICQENGRQGKARNTGVRSSVGQYIMFLDSDDMWLNRHVFSRLSQIITEHNPDYVFTKGYTSIPSDHKLSESEHSVVNGDCEITDADTCISSSDFSFCCWSYVYKRNIFVESGITFAENCFFEDLDFCVRSIYAGGPDARVVKVKFPYYGYRENLGSVTRKPGVKLWIDNLTALERLRLYVKNHMQDSKSAAQMCLHRLQRDLLGKPWRIYKTSMPYKDASLVYCFWRSLVLDLKKELGFREYVSNFPLLFFLLVGGGIEVCAV